MRSDLARVAQRRLYAQGIAAPLRQPREVVERDCYAAFLGVPHGT